MDSSPSSSYRRHGRSTLLDAEDGEEENEELEVACQNVPPRQCMTVCNGAECHCCDIRDDGDHAEVDIAELGYEGWQRARER